MASTTETKPETDAGTCPAPQSHKIKAEFSRNLNLMHITMMGVAFAAIVGVKGVGQPAWQRIGSYGGKGFGEAIARLIPSYGSILVTITVIFASTFALNATIYSATRASYAMGRDRMLPPFLSRRHPGPPVPAAGVGIAARGIRQKMRNAPGHGQGKAPGQVLYPAMDIIRRRIPEFKVDRLSPGARPYMILGHRHVSRRGGEMQIGIHEAKTKLSKLIPAVPAGEEVIIAKSGTPLVKLVTVQPQRGKRPLGLYADKIRFSGDILAPLPDDIIGDFWGGEGDDALSS